MVYNSHNSKLLMKGDYGKETSKFTIDALVDMLARVGKPVKIVVG